MQVKQIAIVAAIASTFAMPFTAHASDIATLNGWGALFAAAQSGQQATAEGKVQGEVKVSLFQRQQPPAAQPEPTPEPAPEATPTPAPVDEPAPVAEAPEMDQPESGDQTAAADDNVGESAEAGQQEMGQAMASANASMSATVNVSGEKVGQALKTVDGVYQAAGTVAEGVTSGMMGTTQNAANKGSGGSMSADMAHNGSMNVAGLASANMASSMNATASMMSAGQLGAITAITSSVIQNVIASRPASITGLLR